MMKRPMYKDGKKVLKPVPKGNKKKNYQKKFVIKWAL